jgi:hypothetical protein
MVRLQLDERQWLRVKAALGREEARGQPNPNTADGNLRTVGHGHGHGHVYGETSN